MALQTPDPVAQVHDRLIARSLEAKDATQAMWAGDIEDLTEELNRIKVEFARFRLFYQWGIEQVATKLNILRQEFEDIHDYSPIEHIRSRLKSPESILTKAVKVGCDLTLPALRERIRDIAGIRITCSFTSDVYWIASMLSRQPDVTVVATKDYIANPKPNGYRSLHLIVKVPVYLSDSTESVFVEIQIRTIAMDFWASVEHKLSYKYGQQLPPVLKAELDDAARIAEELDERMGRLRDEIRPMEAIGSGDARHVDTP